MANTIRPKRSYTSAAVPSGLLASELAINAASPAKMWIGSADGLSSVLVSSLALSDHVGTTDNLTQGSTNKFYADSLSRAALSSTVTGLTYTSSTGVISLTSGYSIPTTTDQTNWGTAYTNRITSLTVTGSSGAATLTSNTLNIPTYTLAGLGGIKLTDLSSTATGLTYTNTTGVFSLTSGYSIPTTSSQTNWDSAYTQRLQWDGGSTNLVAATGRTSLGLVIGTNVQAWDADLDSIAGLAGTSGLLKKTAANTWTLDTSTYLTSNQSITLSGDVTGSGTTAITTTLATVGVAKGGTGLTTLTANNVILGNGTSTPSFVAPGASGNLLTSNGTTWQSSTPDASSSMPTGALMPYAGATAPTGYLLCDGSSVSSSTYLALHAVISNTYGGSAYTGSAGLSFNLPDLKGRMPIGAGTGSGLTSRVRGTTYGTETHTVSNSNITQFSTGAMSANENHTHGSGATGFWVYNSGLGATIAGGSTYNASAGGSANTASTNLAHTHTVGTASPTAINHLPPTIGLNYIIKT